MKPSTVWKRIIKLKNMGNLNIKSNSQYSVIAIVNWGSYQDSEKKGTTKVTGKEQPRNTDKNVKKYIYSLSSDEFDLASFC